MPGEDPSNTLGTTLTSMEVLATLDELDGAGITELAEHMDMPKSTIHGHLTTLKSEEFVMKEGDIYLLGPELLHLGNQVRTRREAYALAREYTERMYTETGFRSVFAAEMDGRAVFIHTASGNKMGWTHERVGNRLYLHNTAVGKAMLAELPAWRVDRVLDEWGLPAETPQSITDRETLRSELETVRERGYATNHEENISDLHGIGVAATEVSGNLIGGFSITGSERPFSDPSRVSELVDAITEIKDEYELELSLSRR